MDTSQHQALQDYMALEKVEHKDQAALFFFYSADWPFCSNFNSAIYLRSPAGLGAVSSPFLVSCPHMYLVSPKQYALVNMYWYSDKNI